ncbi:MAG: RsmD family RNA methyltransferase [Thaumarchaeota archaeon]|nr:RsmD family RNA methyltransferase [Nitrososphaerota archaeon]
MTNRSLVLLSGERSSLPAAEAKALFLAFDPNSRFAVPEPRVMVVETEADPFMVSRRVAFSRRVGSLLESPSDASETVEGRRIRFRSFDLKSGGSQVDPRKRLAGVEAKVDLKHPDYEFTLIRGEKEYLALTAPTAMLQGWSRRRPRARPFFHPSAIFPKLSRALVNLTGCREGDLFLDPFAGTGSIPIEAAAVGARVVAFDQSAEMASGALSNMRHFRQSWEGVVRADAFLPPARGFDAVATDLPYGRVSSTRGFGADSVAERFTGALGRLMKREGRAVVMHSQANKVESRGDMLVEEEHHLYVHRLLTRTITILRRR